eukprot:GFKZ01002032.1.p1 GENE.GFKZ01002032.1~~GFKZ01002032.1.p1  ORF type:complete len:140 (-),score=1.15 GFKZ01002032.1:219-638(-)
MVIVRCPVILPPNIRFRNNMENNQPRKSSNHPRVSAPPASPPAPRPRSTHLTVRTNTHLITGGYRLTFGILSFVYGFNTRATDQPAKRKRGRSRANSTTLAKENSKSQQNSNGLHLQNGAHKCGGALPDGDRRHLKRLS